jgi:hypothetical protein
MEELTSRYRTNLLIKYGKTVVKSRELLATSAHPKNMQYITKGSELPIGISNEANSIAM